MLPPELQAPPPRDPQKAGALLSTNTSKATSCLIGGALLVPAVLFLMRLKFGSIDGLAIGLALGIGGLVELFGVALLAQKRRAAELYRTGIATIGRVRRMEVAGGDQKNTAAYVIVHVEFKDEGGQVLLGQLMTVAGRADADCKEGSEIAVVYRKDNPRTFAVYTPGLGMVPGTVR